MSAIHLTGDQISALETLGQRIRQARLRRNLSQAEMAQRAGVTRKTYVALEAGAPGTSLAVLVKVMAILGYPERLATLLTDDQIGEGIEAVTGRQRARRTSGVADF